MDQITIERARRGERDAMAALLNGLADIWYRFSVSQLRDPDLAREVVQETAVRFMKQLSGFRGESRIESWSLGIALNVVREQRRSASKLDPARLAAGMNLRESEEPTSSGDRYEQDELKRVHELIQSLPDRQREAILLRFFEALSVEETAAVMNCAAGTIKATVHQALRAMRQKLTEQP
ncbi:MAG TPA: RNA polymerase sigma factor [Tepidisphaeraceae bacterium]|nr:RNA polymerase sigma factor [Tepidisphaeraceae bacterium]